MLRKWAPTIGILAIVAALGFWVSLVVRNSDLALPKAQRVHAPPRPALAMDPAATGMLLGESDLPTEGLMALDYSGVLPLARTQATAACYEDDPPGRQGFGETAWQFGDGSETLYEAVSIFDSVANAVSYVGSQRPADQCLVAAIDKGEADYAYNGDYGIYFSDASISAARETTDGSVADAYSLDYMATLNKGTRKDGEFSDVLVMRSENVVSVLRIYQQLYAADGATVSSLTRAAARKIAPARAGCVNNNGCAKIQPVPTVDGARIADNFVIVGSRCGYASIALALG